MVDVTDTFDAFHRVVAALWREFGAELVAAADDDDAIGFDDLVDQLEVDLFLPACARRLREATGENADPDDVARRIRLGTDGGEALPGAAGRYHSHAFPPESVTGDVPAAILTGNLMSL